MGCNCASKGNAIPTCPESPLGYAIIAGVSIAIALMAKLSFKSKVAVSSLSVVGLGYYYDISNKVSSYLFAKHEKTQFKPASQLPDFSELEAENNHYGVELKSISEGEYEGLSLFTGTDKKDVFKISSQLHMKRVGNYVSEIQNFDSKSDSISIAHSDTKFSEISHHVIGGEDYTYIHLITQGTDELWLAVQGNITEQHIDFT